MDRFYSRTLSKITVIVMTVMIIMVYYIHQRSGFDQNTQAKIVSSLDQEKKIDEVMTSASKNATGINEKKLPQREDVVHSTNTTTQVRVIHYDQNALYSEIQKLHDSRYRKPADEKCIQRYPQCIIIGINKCGTRELLDFMKLHPNIVIKSGRSYQDSYFLRPHSTKRPKADMPCSYSNQITVVKDARYFITEDVPERLYNFNKSLKLILLVREPIHRMLSEFTYTYFKKKSYSGKQNYSDMPPFDNQVVNPRTGEVGTNRKEIKSSTYDVPMLRYLKYFSLKQILIIATEQFKENPAGVMYQIEDFLGLKHAIKKDDFVYNEEKQFYCITSADGMACYGQDRGRVELKEMQSETRKKLTEYFKQHNENFFKIIGQRFDW